MNIEDHIPQSNEPTFAETLHALVEENQIDAASDMVTAALVEFFVDYADDPLLFGLLRLANKVRVTSDETTTVVFNTRRKQMRVPHRVAHACHDILDFVCLLLIERARLVVNKTAHTKLPSNFDPSRDRFEFELAREVWSIATARKFVSSILPERIYAPMQDLYMQMLHGLDPRFTSKLLQSASMHSTAEVFMRLYNQYGQEMFHANNNRMAACDDNVEFGEVLEALLIDKKNNSGNGKGDGDNDASAGKFKLIHDESSDDDAYDVIVLVYREKEENPQLHTIPVTSYDLDDDVDLYMNQFMHATNFTSVLFGKLQDIARHALIGQHADDGQVYGSMDIPDRPSYQDLMSHMQGYTPSVWTHQMPAAESEPTFAVYMDVSGSMFSWYNFVRALIVALGRNLDPEHIYGFSDVVVPLDINCGYLKTTHGTSIKAVVEHALENGITNVIMITDLDVAVDPQLETTGIKNIAIVCTDPDKPLRKSCFRLANELNQSNFHYVPVSLEEIQKRDVGGASSFNAKKPKP